MPINPGQFREVVTHLIPASYGSDSYGRADASEFVTDKKMRAEVREQTLGGELIRAGSDEPEQRITLTVRYDDAITARSRFLWRGQTLRVINAPSSPDVQRRLMEIKCSYAGD